jgi:sugar/nucleoside kinase (ribokinase family)
MGPGLESSGGSAGNTCAVAAALGARVGFLGKVADDVLGQVFAHDIRAAGVAFSTAPLPAATAPTARCLILVSPDGQRTMNTFLGACVHFSEADLDHAAIAGAKVTYMEGYLFDPPAAVSAFHAAARIAHGAGRQVSSSAHSSSPPRKTYRRPVSRSRERPECGMAACSCCLARDAHCAGKANTESL